MEKQIKISVIAKENNIVEALRELADVLEKKPNSFKKISTETYYAKIAENKKELISWTEENYAILRKMYNEGVRHKEIAEFFGCSVSAIDSQLNRLGLNNSFAAMETATEYKNMRHFHPYSKDEIEYIKNAFTDGKTIDEIAIHTHRTVKAIKFQLVKLNLIEDENNA